MFKAWKAWKVRKLHIRLAGLEASHDTLRLILDQNPKVSSYYVDELLDVLEAIAKVNKKLEQLK